MSPIPRAFSSRFLQIALVLPLLFLPLHATVLQGDSIHVIHYFPDLSTVANLGDLGTHTVGPATFIYLPAPYTLFYTLTVTDTTIVLENAPCDPGGCGDWSNDPGTTFNGPVITDLSHAPIGNVTIDASSTWAGFDASRLSFDSSHVYIDIRGLVMDGVLRLDVAGLGDETVPEPGTWGLLGAALIALAAAKRRRLFR